MFGQDLPDQHVTASLQVTPESIRNLYFVETSIKSIGAQEHAIIRLNGERASTSIDFLGLGLSEIAGQRTTLRVVLSLDSRNQALSRLSVQFASGRMI